MYALLTPEGFLSCVHPNMFSLTAYKRLIQIHQIISGISRYWKSWKSLNILIKWQINQIWFPSNYFLNNLFSHKLYIINDIFSYSPKHCIFLNKSKTVLEEMFSPQNSLTLKKHFMNLTNGNPECYQSVPQCFTPVWILMCLYLSYSFSGYSWCTAYFKFTPAYIVFAPKSHI